MPLALKIVIVLLGGFVMFGTFTYTIALGYSRFEAIMACIGLVFLITFVGSLIDKVFWGNRR